MTPDELLDLAKQADQGSRTALFGQVTDLFMSPEVRLSDRERALMETILHQLIVDVERAVRQELADRIKHDPAAPPELTELLARDDTEIAVPLLENAHGIRDQALIAIVRDRSRAHAIAVAARRGLSEPVSDTVVDRAARDGDVELLETLAKNPDATLSRRAMEYMIAEARRFDSFHAPLVHRRDLPADLAMRLYWLVAAALKTELIRRHAFDEMALHDALEESVDAARRRDSAKRSLHERARAVVERGGDMAADPRAIIGYVRSDRLPLAIAALARKLDLPTDQIRSVLLEGPMEGLAVLCREAGFGRDQFVTLTGVCSPVWTGGNRVTSPTKMAEAATFFDTLTERHARRVLGYWRSDPAFRKAEIDLAEGLEGRTR